MSRIIGIQHKVKRTAQGEARPTVVYIIDGDKHTSRKLADEDAELNFVLGKLEITQAGKTITEGVREGDSIAMMLGGSGNYLAYALARQAMSVGAKVYRVPAFKVKAYREQQANELTDVSTKKKQKKVKEKVEDSRLLAEMLISQPSEFLEVDIRALNVITATELLRARTDAMKDRIACEQRLRQRTIGAVYTNPTGLYAEGGLEKAFDDMKANDIVFAALKKQEGQLSRELEKALQKIPAYTEIFEKVEGVGPLTAARIIACVGDISNFESDAKLKKFLGVHVMEDGRFPRQRRGERGEFNPVARQALYLIADQFLKREDSVWGKKLREYWAKFKAKHPQTLEINTSFKPLFHTISRTFITHGIPHTPHQTELKTLDDLIMYVATAKAKVTSVDGELSLVHEEVFTRFEDEIAKLEISSTTTSKSFNSGHLLSTAKWRTVTKFVEWLFREWKTLEAKPQNNSDETKVAA
ncbi:transposase [Candidatus Falkowbacteria bacterium]|nr:transposase [Candidatus Falkowbacteria bacterium]